MVDYWSDEGNNPWICTTPAAFGEASKYWEAMLESVRQCSTHVRAYMDSSTIYAMHSCNCLLYVDGNPWLNLIVVFLAADGNTFD